MDEKQKDIYKTLVELEKKLLEGNFNVNLELHSHQSDIDRLREVVDELKEQDLHLKSSQQSRMDNVGKEVSVTTEKLSDISYQLESIEERLKVLEEHKSSADKRVWSYVDKVIIAIISGIMTLLFNSL